MKSNPESVNAPKDTRIVRDDIRLNNPRTIRGLRDRDVFVMHSRSTR